MWPVDPSQRAWVPYTLSYCPVFPIYHFKSTSINCLIRSWNASTDGDKQSRLVSGGAFQSDTTRLEKWSHQTHLAADFLAISIRCPRDVLLRGRREKVVLVLPGASVIRYNVSVTTTVLKGRELQPLQSLLITQLPKLRNKTCCPVPVAGLVPLASSQLQRIDPRFVCNVRSAGEPWFCRAEVRFEIDVKLCRIKPSVVLALPKAVTTLHPKLPGGFRGGGRRQSRRTIHFSPERVYIHSQITQCS